MKHDGGGFTRRCQKFPGVRSAAIIVSDTFPLSNLIVVKQVDLLQQLFGALVIPTTVYRDRRERQENWGMGLFSNLESSIEIHPLENFAG
jgi:predicted nucleic acid-binding protein